MIRKRQSQSNDSMKVDSEVWKSGGGLSLWRAVFISYYAVSFAGTAAYCLLWIEFSRETLNNLWLFGIPTAGIVLEFHRIRCTDCGPCALGRRIHLTLCGIIAVLVVAWPGIALPMNLPTENRLDAPDAPLVALLPLAPYAVALIRWIMGYRQPKPGFLER